MKKYYTAICIIACLALVAAGFLYGASSTINKQIVGPSDINNMYTVKVWGQTFTYYHDGM